MKKAIMLIIFIFILLITFNCEYLKLLTKEELLEIAGIEKEPNLGLEIINPVNGMSIAGTKTVLAAATKTNITKVEFYIDGVKQIEDIDSPYQFIWNTASGSYLDGIHTVRVRAYDTVNNMQEKMNSITVNNSGGVDTTNPAAGISFPANSSNIIGNTLVISNSTDNTAISRVCFYLGSGYGYIGSAASGNGRVWLRTDSCSNGSTTLIVVAFDTAGNMATASINVTVSNVNNDKDYMQSVPGGTFTIGWSGITSNTAADSLSPFYMGKYEMTQGLWNTVYTWAKSNGYTFFYNTVSNYNLNYGRGNLKWYDMVKLCNAMSEMNGLIPCYYTDASKTAAYIYRTGDVDITNSMVNWNANGYRLPTEAEWEYAARYIDGTIWRDGDKFSGSDIIDEVGWYLDNSNDLVEHPVGQKNSNQAGIYDMTGNKWEMCWDWYYSTYTGGTDQHGPDASTALRSIRGGNGFNSLDMERVAVRRSNSPDSYDGSTAFRVVRIP